MPRVCIREGCGVRLVKKNGRPDFRRMHCSKLCRDAERLEKLQRKREQARQGKCPTCGLRRSSKAHQTAGVKLDTVAPGDDLRPPAIRGQGGISERPNGHGAGKPL